MDIFLLWAKIRQQEQYSIACKTKPRYLFNNGVFMIAYPFFFLAGTTFFFELPAFGLVVLECLVLE